MEQAAHAPQLRRAAETASGHEPQRQSGARIDITKAKGASEGQEQRADLSAL
jgi:hypothetical protein